MTYYPPDAAKREARKRTLLAPHWRGDLDPPEEIEPLEEMMFVSGLLEQAAEGVSQTKHSATA